MSTEQEFPTTIAELTPLALTQCLQKSGHLGQGRVASASGVLIGTGKMGDNARISMTYEGDAGGLPSSLVAKLPATDETARNMAGLQGAYYNEVMFYRQFAKRTSMRTPQIFASELSPDKTSFMLLMEDMAPAEPGSQLVGESRARAGTALAEAAKLAAAFYGDETITDADHVMKVDPADGGAFGQLLLQQNWPGFLDRFGHGISAECVQFGERFIESYTHFVNRYQGAKTLAHGDFRCENILFNGDTAIIVDWQTPSHTSVMTDAAYFLGGSLQSQDRRDWERELVAEYRVQLAHQGVELNLSECWEQYREYAMHGILITVLGASFSGAEERGDRMFLTMIQRHLQQCVDLDAQEFLS
ncbi:DUF1679 domain-containing protein [Halieaceae bacterium IMCC14734]|uniref:DUF1679 domain-containing protein n=1 Tax=Candidatus Litorirhabdus singularis TaxID=2518993 RepID=A0ABT3TK15_9GAMM|nr:phosphotransferase [Candidatus Litorirhabdus singularis]MCX2981707.1 DUF1679 domain-containing protein [Candidatus Litorirhabdus singularis]